MWARRAELTTDNVTEVVTTLYGKDEVSAALVSLWARVDQLTAVEVNAIRSMLDGGFAERFLERQRQAAEGLNLAEARDHDADIDVDLIVDDSLARGSA